MYLKTNKRIPRAELNYTEDYLKDLALSVICRDNEALSEGLFCFIFLKISINQRNQM